MDETCRMAIDVETTGLDPGIDRIKSVSIVIGTLKLGATHRASYIVDAGGQPSSPEALLVHRIPDIVVGALPPALPLRQIEQLRSSCRARVLMHHKQFDAAFLAAAYRREGLPIPDYLADTDQIDDTMDIGRAHYPGQAANLSHLARAAGVAPWLLQSRAERHDSLDDAWLCFELWRHHAVPTTLDVLSAAAPKPTHSNTSTRNTTPDAAAGLDW